MSKFKSALIIALSLFLTCSGVLASTVTHISAGIYHSVASKDDSTLWAWGDNTYGQLGDGTKVDRLIPVQISGLTGVVAISAGYYHTVTLKNDGTVWTWGNNGNGQLGDGTTTDRLTPIQVSGLTEVTAVSTGSSHTVALKSDGTVWSWGWNYYGQLGDGTTTNHSTPAQVPCLTGVVAISAGWYYSVALKKDGTVWAWGYNFYGQLGDGTTTNHSTPAQVPCLTGVVAISAGYYHAVAMKNDGTVWSWGHNFSGQLGDGTTTDRLTPVQVSSLTEIVAVSAGPDHTVALKNDGTVWAWGWNSSGQLGDGTTTDRWTPVQVSGLTGVTAVSAGSEHTVALKNDNTVWTWGRNYHGQLGDGTEIDRWTPVQTRFDWITPTGTVVINDDAVYTNSRSVTLGLSATNNIGTVYQMRVSNDSMIRSKPWETYSSTKNWTLAPGDGTKTVYVMFRDIAGNESAVTTDTIILDSTPPEAFTPIASPSGWTEGDVTVTFSTTDALSGMNHYEVSLDNGAFVTATSPYVVTTEGNHIVYVKAVDNLGNSRISRVHAYISRTSPNAFISNPYRNGRQICFWVSYDRATVINLTAADVTLNKTGTANGTISVSDTSNDARIVTISDITGEGTLGISIAAGTASDAFGRTALSAGPSDTIKVGKGIVAISAGGNHSIALRSNGTVWTWGWNYYGQLGDGTTINRSTPRQVSGLTGVVAVSAGSYHTTALRDDGTVWTWGWNKYGELGDGTNVKRLTPVQVTGLFGVVAIATGGVHTVALKDDGTVWTWGYNHNGQLGDGTTTDRWTPVQVSGLTDVIAVSSSGIHTVALKDDGTVWAWGDNSSGQLGDGTTTQRLTPVMASGFTGVTAITAGYNSTFALKIDGTVWGWGSNSSGQLGDGLIWTNRLTPTQVSDIARAVAISSGGYHSGVLKSDSTVWTWGDNSKGQLGDGTTMWRPTLGQVTGPFGVVEVSAGEYHTIVLKNDVTVWTWGDNYYGQLGDGTTAQRLLPVEVIFGWNVPGAVSKAKGSVDSTPVYIEGAIVSASFDGFFYIESDKRECGIRVEKSGHALSVGMRADITGSMSTNSNGERCILADTVTPDGTGDVKPVGMTIKMLGGGKTGLQEGVKDGYGLNNIGLLVRIWGKPSIVDGIYYISDGSGTSVKLILPSGVSIDPTWQYIGVTGISSCEKVGNELQRVLLVRPGEVIIHN